MKLRSHWAGLFAALFLMLFTFLFPLVATAAPVVYLAGDSTVMTYGAGSYPKQGWGARLPDLFPSGVAFSNHAIGGRSSKSFYDEGRLAAILRVIKPGDYLFVQFGHNDIYSSDPRLYTDPYGSYKTYLGMYVDLARQYGAIPVLVTPMGKRRYNSSGAFLNDFADRASAMRQLAAEKSVPLIDLNAKSIAFYNGIGVAATTDIFLWLPAGQYAAWPNGVQDGIHFQEHGAAQLARMVAEGIEENRIGLRSLLGAVTYPAEAAVLSGSGTVRSRTYGGWQGRGYVDFPANGGVLAFNRVIGKASGARTLRIRYANGSGATRSGQLVVNGVATLITFAPTGGWSSWGTKDVTIMLRSGTANAVSLRSTGGDLANIDTLTVY
jgi:lysophospholipase L1-like esterase